MNVSRRTAILGFAVLTVGAVGVAVAVTNSAAPVRLHGSEMLPAESAQDWVTYGDHLVVFTVEAESRGPFVPDEEGSRKGTVERLLDTKTLDIAWSRPGAREFDSNLELSWGGWFIDGNDEREFLYDPAVRLLVGGTYVGMMTYIEIPDEKPFWAFLSTSALVPAEGGQVGNGNDELITNGRPFEPGDSGFEVLDVAWGGTIIELAALLESTDPDPAAVPYMDIPAVERFQRTAASTS